MIGLFNSIITLCTRLKTNKISEIIRNIIYFFISIRWNWKNGNFVIIAILKITQCIHFHEFVITYSCWFWSFGCFGFFFNRFFLCCCTGFFFRLKYILIKEKSDATNIDLLEVSLLFPFYYHLYFVDFA